MLISEFNFDLPDELIAQEPLAQRDRSRMLIVQRAAQSFRDSAFAELPTLLNAGDVVVLNNTRVFPARLRGQRVLPMGERGAQVEALLSRLLDAATNEWEVIARPGRALKVGAQVEFGEGRLRGEVTGLLEDGKRHIRFTCDGDFNQVVDAIGNTPLPPYIKRDTAERLDEPRYQTVFAKQRGAIAAPTAGLHFTPRVLDELKARGVQIVEITHHVGYATFQPVRVERVEEHRIEAEHYEISADAAQTINTAKAAGQRVLAVGTTATRALESAANAAGMLRAEQRATELFIYPGHQFKSVDALLTNFHLPQSSLLLLVSALAGRELVLRAYRHAVAERYRFYSYGDCMLIV
ncbi:MAG: tRNA preQ1(34) S-adenosylmethionine ribosyltransferase-isomerase QueA [Acidobacteria bacterium]|nr:tRNA preQ1(34) S-adenosylmethionine ribosyltransferase-isomerase QueA [Acidobacteriota bacterium]MBI3424398.1 tRNA preQ1(34) S-adenosylmethionine ribosyltransferase-isomerase QueA [Acidobacteriota bacterium]